MMVSSDTVTSRSDDVLAGRRARDASRPRGRGGPRGSGLLTAVALLLTAVAVAFVTLPCLCLVLDVRFSDLLRGLRSPAVQEALLLSVRTSLLATAICCVIGTGAAYVLARTNIPGKRLIDAILQLPVVLPPVVAGVALLMAFGRRGLLGNALSLAGVEVSFTTIAVVMAQCFIALPFFIQASRGGFESVPRTLEEASYTLGVSDLATFFRVTIPLSWPSLVSGAVLCWGRAVGEFGATIMFAGNMRGVTRTMPLAILTAMQGDVDTAVVLAVMLLAFSGVMFVGARWVLGGMGHRP